MKKTMFVVLIALAAGVVSFAQALSPQMKALQGTWVLIGGMSDDESFDEAAVKAENLEILYIFKGNEVTISKNGELVGPLKFEAASGFVLVGTGNVGKLPYNLQGRILILHEGGYTFIYRKR